MNGIDQDRCANPLLRNRSLRAWAGPTMIAHVTSAGSQESHVLLFFILQFMYDLLGKQKISFMGSSLFKKLGSKAVNGPAANLIHGINEGDEASILLCKKRLRGLAGMMVPQMVFCQLDLRAIDHRSEQRLHMTSSCLCNCHQAGPQCLLRSQHAAQLRRCKMQCVLFKQHQELQHCHGILSKDSKIRQHHLDLNIPHMRWLQIIYDFYIIKYVLRFICKYSFYLRLLFWVLRPCAGAHKLRWDTWF